MPELTVSFKMTGLEEAKKGLEEIIVLQDRVNLVPEQLTRLRAILQRMTIGRADEFPSRIYIQSRAEDSNKEIGELISVLMGIMGES